MPSIFKINDNATLASRLRCKLNVHRETHWTNFINELSKFYKLSKNEQYIQATKFWLETDEQFRSLTDINSPIYNRYDAYALLSQPWFFRSKENFSWSPLIDGFVGNAAKKEIYRNTETNLTSYNKMVILAIDIENELNKECLNIETIQAYLGELKTLLDTHERNNIFIELFIALAGVVTAPLACLIGALWIIPAYCLELPYLGKSAFFLDAFQWFVDSLITTARCLLFPIAMIHAYNTTGSSNLLKGECTRIVETLTASINDKQQIKSDADALQLTSGYTPA